jgi:cytochrome P450
MTEERVPPGPPSLSPTELRRARMRGHEFLADLAREYGDVVGYPFMLGRVYLLSHPSHIKDVLVTRSSTFERGPAQRDLNNVMGDGMITSVGELHKRERRLARPGMSRESIARYTPMAVDFASRARDRWTEGEVILVQEEMGHLTLSLITKAVFDVDLDQEKWWPLRDAMRVCLGALQQRSPTRALAATPAFNAAFSEVDANVYRLIDEHRESPKEDLLSMLISGHDPDGTGEPSINKLIRDEAVTLLAAGRETTTQAMTWSWYLLSQHPEAEAKLHQEIASVLDGRVPEYADLSEMRWARMVASEALRLYPPVYAFDRVAKEPVEIGGYDLPEGAIEWVSQWVLHHDPRFFDDPWEFRPERWAEDGPSHERYAYFPFGVGANQCYGEPFAWMSLTVSLAVIGAEWELDLAPGYEVEIEPLMTLAARGGMPMVPRRRQR